MRITVLGTGTSVGVPVIGCRCEVCRSTAPENNRLRSSVYIEHAGGKLLVDCSTDFRQQALRYRIPRVDAVILTHNHADHINGIDDLRSFNFVQRSPIDLYATADVLHTVRHRYEYAFSPTQIGGGVPRLNLQEIDPARPFFIGGLRIVPVPIKHGVLDILGYRIGRNFAYLTDCSAVPESSVPLLEGIEILVLDALRPTPHSTHFSLSEALAFSQRIGPAQTWFTHITCKMEHFATNASLPPNAQLLHDGQVIEVEEGETGDLRPGAGGHR